MATIFINPSGVWGDRFWREQPDGYVPIEDRGPYGWDGECRDCGPRYFSYVKQPGAGKRCVCRRCGAEWFIDGVRSIINSIKER